MSLITIFGDIPDPRRGNAQRHELLDILTIALVASICGAETCVDFAEFAEDREVLLREFLTLENGLPSRDTFSRVFRLLDPGSFGLAFAAFLDDLGADGVGVLAIDGKTLRRSFDRAGGRSALHVATAFGTQARMAIGSRAVAAGENEITAARALLETLTLEGALVTGDAIHCQAETAALIEARGGDWMFALKANRPAMLAEVAAFFDDPANPRTAHETTDADHVRVERRKVEISHDVAWISSDRRYAGEPRLPGLAAIARVTSQRDEAVATRFYVSSAPMSPVRFASAIRDHWGIENRLHWVLDTAFDEDRARNRKDNGPENLAILRKLALNVMRRSCPKLGISRKRKRAGWSDDFARTVIGQMR